MIVVGSVNADWVVAVPRLPGPGETALGGDVEHHHGGKGANQAAAAARAGAGASVVLVAAVGEDESGERELAALAADGVDVSLVARIAGVATGLAMITVAGDSENQIVVASGANARLDGALVAAALGRLDPPLASDDVVLACNEVGDEAIAAALAAAGHAGATALLNPAPARPLPPEVLERRPLLTPNEHEARTLADRDGVPEAARALHALTGAPVLVTRGAAGALLLGAGDPLAIPAPPTTPVDTTGAGDVLNGVLAARLAAGDELPEAARRAVAAASRATEWRGAREP